MFIPKFLTELGKDSPEIQAWLNILPDLVKQAKEMWGLELFQPFVENASCSYVVRCIVHGKENAVLKIGLPHEEALHEIEGLRLLNGNPTVHLLDFDTKKNMMLLEDCIPGTPLSLEPEFTQDEVISTLLPEIWETKNIGKDFRPLGDMVSLWNKGTYEQLDRFPDQVLAKQGCKLKEKLLATTENEVLLATDLHAGNVLRAQRKAWLVIDIKPYVGDPVYDLTQHLLNCKERLRMNPLDTIKRVATLSNVCSSRLKKWIFARLASENEGANQDLAIQIKNTPL